MMIIYPVLDIGNKIPLSEIWGSTVGFILILVAVVAAIGLASKRLSVAAMGGYLTFAYFASNVGIQLLETILFVTLTLAIIGTSMKLWKSEGLGD